MALFIYTLIVIWFHQTGHQLLRFPFRPWYTKKEEPSFADMSTTLRLGCPVCAHFVHYTSRRNRVPPRRGFRVEVQ